MDKRKKQIQNYIRIIFMAVTVIVMFLLYNIYIYAEDEEVLVLNWILDMAEYNLVRKL